MEPIQELDSFVFITLRLELIHLIYYLVAIQLVELCEEIYTKLVISKRLLS